MGPRGLQVRRVMNAWGGVQGAESSSGPVPGVVEHWKGGKCAMTTGEIAQSFERAILTMPCGEGVRWSRH